MYNYEIFINGLKKLFSRQVVEETDNAILIKVNSLSGITTKASGEDKILCEFLKSDLERIIQNTNEKRAENFSLIDEMNFEHAVKLYDSFRFPYIRYNDEEQFSVSEHGYSLKLSKASQEYIFMVICEISISDSVDTDFILSAKHRINRGFGVISYQDFCDNFCMLTAKITSPVNCSHSEFSKMLNTYLFNIAYNNSIVFTTINFLEPSHLPRRRRVARDGQLFPYKTYKGELLKYYYQAASASMPMTQYLAYYHVAEYFFQSIAEDDALSKIESVITHPSFSPHSKESIKSFYNKIKKIMKNQKEEGVWEEKNGLILCLKKLVPDLEQLKSNIEDIDQNAIVYYRDNPIPFASIKDENNDSSNDKVRINFSDSPEAIYANIRNRVYLVRNAIAHSKEGAYLRYEPFKHDKELQKEIPLIRAISEEIIINSSKDLNIKHQ